MLGTQEAPGRRGGGGGAVFEVNRRIKQRSRHSCVEMLSCSKGWKGTAPGSVQTSSADPTARFPPPSASRPAAVRCDSQTPAGPCHLASRSDSLDTYWESKLCHLPAFPSPPARLCTSTSSLLECWLKWKGSALQAVPVALFLYNPSCEGTREEPFKFGGKQSIV